MITRIDKIKSIGSYKSYCGSGIKEFNQFNIIYGENGSGKTILSKLISLYSNTEDEKIKDDIYKNLFTSSSQLELKINGTSTKLIKSSYPKEKIFVFNSLFVANYLHDGNTPNIKRFKTDDKTVARIESPTIKTLKNDNVEIEKLIGINENEGLQKNIRELKGKIDISATNIREEWNSQKVLTGKNLVKPENNFIPKHRTESLVSKDIDKNLKELELLQRNDFAVDLESINRLEKKEIFLDVKGISKDLSTFLTNVAKESVVTQIQKITESKVIQNTQNWYEDGLKILVYNKDNNELICPLCNSDLTLVIEAIIDSYQGYFDESLANLKFSLNVYEKSLDTVIDSLKNRDEVTLNSYISKYSNAFEGKVRDISFKEIDRLQESLTILKNDINAKMNDSKYKSNTDFISIDKLIYSYNIFVKEFEDLRKILLGYLTSRTIPSKVESTLRNLYYEKFSALAVKISGEENPIIKLNNLESQKSELEKKKTANLVKINAEVLKLQVESKKVNEYLIKLNITNFKVSIGDDLSIVYTDGESKDSLKHSLSEGEKTTLAFAYFLSKMEYEIGKANYKDFIVYMDDPISSIDEDRMFNTANLIYQELGNVKQLFVSSHSFKFLRILNNFLKFYNRKKKDNHLLNLYKIRYNIGSEIINLPEEIAFFTTMYYSKLQLIIKYLSGEDLTEDEKKSIPNSVRIVLESFLSFKFAYLKGEKFGVTPGMKELFEAVKKEDDSNYEHLVEVDGISKENWKDEIDYLFIHYTNMFSHGNPSAIDNDEPPTSEKELKKFCETTIGIIKFLGGIHFKLAQVNAARDI